MAGKRFAVLLCAEDSEFIKKKYGGYYGVFLRMLGVDGETWDMYRVSAGEFPGDGDIGMYDGFVITGSCSDAHGNDAWICHLVEMLQKLDSLKKKVLGICFGHQILCRALGGKTGRAKRGWDIGLTTLRLATSPKLSSPSLKIPSRLPIIECHRDEVVDLPPRAELLASSDKTRVEMFCCGDHVMGIQGHPEYTKDILRHLVDRLLQRGLITDRYAEELKAKVDTWEPDGESWRKLCVSFLKGGS